MKTPFGKECRFYYADYFRGREKKECRLIDANPNSDTWNERLCQACPVPDIMLANACPNLMLQARVGSRFFGLMKQVETRAACKKYRAEVAEPRVGCGHCAEESEK